MQKEILLFFLSISSPALDAIANIASFFGEQAVLIILIGWILYADDKKKGFAITGPILISALVMSITKAIVRAPRPFQVLDEIDGKRLSTATGYSFPSGHTTISSSMYSAIAIAYKKKVVSIICAILIVMVALSRMVLGVHWPLDVFGGLIIGIPFSIILYPIFYKIGEDSDKKYKVSIILGAVTCISSIAMALLLRYNLIDDTAFADLLKTAAMASGAYFGFALEVKKLNYKTDGTLAQKIIRLILLATMSLFIISSLKTLFGANYYIGCFVRYTLVGLFLTYLFPLLFKGLFNEN
jgi:undecaprenyl-diphosphatase